MSADVMIEPRRPNASKWVDVTPSSWPKHRVRCWERRGVMVVSTLDEAKLPQREETGPQWHISISKQGRWRATADEVARALRDFDMVGAEEDNHHPGVARHFWMPVDPAHRVTCECKEDEAIAVEPDGYTWSNDVDPSKCRGCEFARLMGKPCPVHAVVGVADG